MQLTLLQQKYYPQRWGKKFYGPEVARDEWLTLQHPTAPLLQQRKTHRYSNVRLSQIADSLIVASESVNRAIALRIHTLDHAMQYSCVFRLLVLPLYFFLRETVSHHALALGIVLSKHIERRAQYNALFDIANTDVTVL